MEIKQLKYFVVAADVGSFSEAAKVLYTTQSSVSKVIASLEMELGYQLFKREGKGINLTSEGKKFHNRASKLVLDFASLETDSIKHQKNMVKISANHSSWLANCFSQFYELHKDEDVCYSFHADTTSNIVNRIRLMEDEVGFVYVFPETRLQFEYELKKYQLTFEKLKSVDGMVYFQPDDTVGKLEKSVDNIHNMKFIQSEQDEYFRNGLWHTEDGEDVTIKDDIAVITNSDYVMHAFLEKNSLANLSADSFNSYDTSVRPGLRLKSNEGEIQFGILKNDSVKISPIVNEFIDYICDQLRRK
ncbi:MAG: LysR family transcriptional regulator [Pseudobutyrivibrio ruminis]|uniref:LysR family transcriptional regulator n=1 Tax=Pseudobutyrivibrio ruminis TaxID=46206 RepID=A0A927UBG5_9FIRM|nr:LysR family transcriptional regulator [Pseudobutyrivibrio sp.]MBE5920722.1 LysR family transcriptional regulator [Pseudobutyrivibrio ruminis]MBQ6462562.1 LysR family transcriptional regulator [Pseudobutyrivibrio sp.]